MRDDRPSHTAEFAAAMRAGEALLPPQRRTYYDPYARYFLHDRKFKLLIKQPLLARRALEFFDRRFPGIMGEAFQRCRYADEVLADAVDEGVRQFVLLGAGFDSTAMRLPADTSLTIYEVDHPATQEHKRAVLAEHAADALDRVRMVSCDFTRENVSERLAASGFDAGEASLVSWMAVTMYIERQAVEATLRDLATCMTPGSRLVFDYMHKSVIDGTATSPGAMRAKRVVEKRGEPYVFGLDPSEAEGWLEEFGFRMAERLEAQELERRYAPEQGEGRQAADFMGLIQAVRA